MKKVITVIALMVASVCLFALGKYNREYMAGGSYGVVTTFMLTDLLHWTGLACALFAAGVAWFTHVATYLADTVRAAGVQDSPRAQLAAIGAKENSAMQSAKRKYTDSQSAYAAALAASGNTDMARKVLDEIDKVNGVTHA